METRQLTVETWHLQEVTVGSRVILEGGTCHLVAYIPVSDSGIVEVCKPTDNEWRRGCSCQKRKYQCPLSDDGDCSIIRIGVLSF